MHILKSVIEDEEQDLKGRQERGETEVHMIV